MLMSKFLNDFHLFGALILIFFPLLLPLFFYMGLKNTLKPLMGPLLLVYVIVPTHWVFFNNSCFITSMTKNSGGYTNSKSKFYFIENNLKWLYKPIMDIIGLKWLKYNDMLKFLVGHILINILIIWYYLFYVY